MELTAGPPSQPRLYVSCTESVVPGKPTSLQVRPSFNSIHVRWTAPEEQSIMIGGYVLGYGIGIPDVFRQVLDAGQRHHTIRALREYSSRILSLKLVYWRGRSG